MSKTDEAIQESTARQGRRRWLWPAVLVVIVVVVAALLLTRGSVEDDALATVEGYFDAFNSGDVDATLAFLLDEGGEFNVTSEPDSPFAQSDYNGTVNLIAWSVASETNWEHGECSVVEGVESPVVVECDFQIADLLRSTMGLPDLPASLTAAVDGSQIVGFEETFTLLPGEGAFARYLEWLEGAHPDEVELAAQLDWGSTDEAVASGEARARYADEWAASLGE